MRQTLRHLRARPRLSIGLVVGAGVALALPTALGWVVRCLVGWNAAIWLYLALAAVMMARSDHDRLRRTALAHAEGAATVLGMAIAAVAASLIGIVVELSAAKVPGARHAATHVLLAVSTVAGAWLLLPTLFALTYASAYHTTVHGTGLRFPDQTEGLHPGYSEFLYFSFTIAVASQTADVSITTARMRRLVLMQSVWSFVFNTAILAFMVNMAASLF